MIQFDFQKKCYRCSACVQQCPTGAISLTAELTPTVDVVRCIRCGRCDSVCLHLTPPAERLPITGTAAFAKNNNDSLRRMSSSGGMFYALAAHTLLTGGAVCGCIWDENFQPKHIVSDRMEDIRRMMGSKYVMSDLGDSIPQMEKLLKEGRTVLFSGVPCQTEAVVRCLRSYRSQLLVVSLVCHGFIDRSLWANFLSQTVPPEKQLAQITMRDKSNGWANYGLKFVYTDSTSQISYRNSDGYFLKCFTSGLFQRDRCLTCQYKGGAISADILLGDGWGAEKLFPAFADTLGISSVLCRTELGIRAFKAVAAECAVVEIPVETLLQTNPRITMPEHDSLDRHRFFRDYRAHPKRLTILCKRYAQPSLLSRGLLKIYRLFVNRFYR